MKKYWKSIEEYKSLAKSGDLPKQEAEPEFSVEGLTEDEKTGTTSRRDFLKALGFSVGYAALASSCEMPVRKAIPYLNQPEDIQPGVANYYASTFYDGHDYCSLLVKTREGRPIKIEGNRLSPVTLGGTTARVQASVLSLYDMARLQSPMKDKEAVSWDAVDGEIKNMLSSLSADGGRIGLLTSSIISPTTNKLIGEFIEKFPGTEWIVYDSISQSAMLEANEKNFGVRAIPTYAFDKAKVIVGFNADFLGGWISPVQYTKQYVKGRSLTNGNEEMSRHLQYESCMSLTGSNADYRHPIKPSEELPLLLDLYNKLAGGAGDMPSGNSSIEIDGLAKELSNNRGKSLIVSGTNDLQVQLVVNAINNLLGNYGSTLDLSNPVNLKQGSDMAMDEFVKAMGNGSYQAVLAYNVNPAYDYHDQEAFSAAMGKVGMSISFAETMDETASLCKYVLPANHYLESWDDAQPSANEFSLQQPCISPLFKTRQMQDTLLKWLDRPESYYDSIQAYWEENLMPLDVGDSSFSKFWNKNLHDGIFTKVAEEVPALEFMPSPVRYSSGTHEGLELVLYEKIGLGTGKYANNPWLQELPDPITCCTWDNYVAVPFSYAKENELKTEDVVRINGEFELPVLVQPGQALGTIAIALGYGRTSGGRVSNGVGKNVFPLAFMEGGHKKFSGSIVTMEKTGETYPLALTQDHNTMEDRAIVRETTLEQWKEDPKSGNEMHMGIVEQNLTLYEIPEFDGYHWGMAINLNACIGCGNCAVSCQAENNVAVIGKEEVKNRRIMHWIRIDRYYSEEVDNPEVTHIPVMCQHCDNAPCENVCPVAATPHSDEGLNQMAYNRCIGTRYCMNNCPYKVRRFNWFEYSNNKDFDYNFSNAQEKLTLNPDVVVRSRGVVEKCSLCIQRIQEVKLKAKQENRAVKDGEVMLACQQSCPGDAIVFGDMNDPRTEISKLIKNPRTYQLLEQVHTLPSVNYVTKVRNMNPDDKHHNYRTNYPSMGEVDETGDLGDHHDH